MVRESISRWRRRRWRELLTDDVPEPDPVREVGSVKSHTRDALARLRERLPEEPAYLLSRRQA